MYMDIHNNDVGIEIGLANPKASINELCQIIKERISSGDLLILNEKENDLIKSDGNPIPTSEIRRIDTATKIAIDILNNKDNEKKQMY